MMNTLKLAPACPVALPSPPMGVNTCKCYVLPYLGVLSNQQILSVPHLNGPNRMALNLSCARTAWSISLEVNLIANINNSL